MSKRIITKYNKLNSSIKNAIQVKFPHGFELELTKMKHLIKGYIFEGFVFEHDDTTYLIEYGDSSMDNHLSYAFQDQNEENELDDDIENLEIEKE